MPYPLPLTRTEAYLAYKAGVIQQSDLKPSLAVTRNGIDAWLAYWTGLANYYPIKNLGKNIIDYAGHLNAGSHDGIDVSLDEATGQITVSGQPTRGYAKIVNTYDITNLLEDGKEYTISQSSYDNKLYAQVNANPPTGTPTYIYNYNSAKTFTVDKTTYPRYYLVIQTGAQSAWTAPQTITRAFQLEKGSSASAFEPYTGEPLILQEEEAYIAYLCGVINEYPEKCLRRVGAYLRYLISARWGRPDHPLNREELYLSLLKTQVIPSGDPSSDIEIDGTAKAAFVDVKMYGDTSQVAYTGKNLLGPYSGTGTHYGVTTTPLDNGYLRLSGTASSTWFRITTNAVPLGKTLPAGTYTFSTTKAPVGFTFTLRLSSGGSGYEEVIIGKEQTSARITTTEDNTRYYLFGGSITGSPVVDGDYGLMLESGNDATSFEPYVGGQPSPNPDYPQSIQTVTGEQTVEIVGKNKLDVNAEPYSIILADYEVNGDEIAVTYNPDGGGTGNYSYVMFRVYVGKDIEAGQTYTLSYDSVRRNIGEPSGRILFTTYSSTSETPNSNLAGANYPDKSVTFTVPNNAIVVGVALYCPKSSGVTQTYSKVMLEKGSSATSFAPYSKHAYPINLGSIELCKLGSYQDYIWKDGDEWKVHKSTGVVIYDGSNDEDWSEDTSGIYSRKIITIEDSLNVGAVRKADSLSDHFRADTTNDYGIFFRNNKKTYYYPDSDVTTVEEWRTWLSSNNINTIYPLATPTDTVITNQTLIDQLEALVAGGAENGTTYIKVNATDPNLPGLLYVEAPKYE